MGRLRILKERNYKIKVTACSLALALAIGSTQGLGTYALFTDTEDLGSNLAISTGDVDVEVYPNEDSDDDNDASEKPGFQGEIIKYGDIETKKFYILNKGTLKQKLKFKLNTTSNLDNKILQSITYKLDINNGSTTTNLINTNFQNIKNTVEVSLEDTVLPGERIDFISTISLENATDKTYEVRDIEFDLNIFANQIGYEYGKGFYDLYNQSNYFTIGESIGGKLIAYFKNDRKRIGILIPFERLKVTDIESGEGEFKKENINTESSMTGYFGFDIYRNKNEKFNVGDNGIGATYSEEQTLTAKVKYNGKDQWWKIYFRYIRGDLQAYYIVIDEPTKKAEVLIESEIVDSPKVEDEFPIEPEVVYPPNQEIEEQSKSEVVESPNIEEVLQSQPDVLEQPTEEIQGVLPSQTDIIVERKEETDIEE